MWSYLDGSSKQQIPRTSAYIQDIAIDFSSGKYVEKFFSYLHDLLYLNKERNRENRLVPKIEKFIWQGGGIY